MGWAAFSLWVAVAALALTRSTDIIGWGLRFRTSSAPESTPLLLQRSVFHQPQQVTGRPGDPVGTLIVLGYGGVFSLDFRLRTPMSFIMPSGFMQNPLVRDYMLPPWRRCSAPGVPPEA